jgi:hypothetical protein
MSIQLKKENKLTLFCVTLQHIPAALKVKRRTDERQRRREAQAQEKRKTQDQPVGPIGAQG